jgi:hypothetical protein
VREELPVFVLLRPGHDAGDIHAGSARPKAAAQVVPVGLFQ